MQRTHDEQEAASVGSEPKSFLPFARGPEDFQAQEQLSEDRYPTAHPGAHWRKKRVDIARARTGTFECGEPREEPRPRQLCARLADGCDQGGGI